MLLEVLGRIFNKRFLKWKQDEKKLKTLQIVWSSKYKYFQNNKNKLAFWRYVVDKKPVLVFALLNEEFGHVG